MSQLSTNKQRYTLIPTPFDGKRTNCRVSGSDVIIETIPEYLARVTSDIRDTFLVTVMLPKSGHSAGTFPIATFSTVLADFDFKLYGFVGGLADENFIEITFSSVESFLDLTDTPDSYTGQSKKFVRVKEDLSGLEFFPLETTSITIDVHQPSHSLSVGYPIRVSGTNTYVGAQANNEANAEVVGYVTEIVDGNNFKYVPIGEVTTGVPSVAAGTVLFLSPTVQGGLTSTEPTTVGQVSKPLMVVIESGAKALFINYRGMKITPEGEGGGGITDYSEIIKFDSGVTEGTDLYTFNGSVTKTINFKSGTNISFTTASGEVTISADGGGGDVTGPSSAVDSNIAVYDSTTGKIIKDGGTKISDLATTSSLSGYVPTTTTVNGKALSSNISLSPSDIGSPSGSGTCSGTNTGDQTSIVGITGTMAQFDTAVTDGNFVYQGQALGTPASGTLTNCTFPTLNQNTSGTAANITGIAVGANGGTGVANTGKTITIGGNLTFSGAYTTTFTVSNTTSITLPTSGTLMANLVEDTTPELGGNLVVNQKNIDVSATLSTNSSYSGIIETGTVGENVVFGDVLYLKFSDGKWWKAKADAYATTPALRMAMASISADASGVLLIEGNVRYDSWSLAERNVWLSAATAGAITTTQPSTTGNQIQFIGTAKTSTTMYFKPSNDVGEK